MPGGEFVKRYDGPDQADRVARAVRHHRWLGENARPLRQPRICAAGASSITFERIEGRHARPGDLPALARLLGDAHGTAWSRALRNADLAAASGSACGIEDYLTCRRAALRRRLELGYLDGTGALRAALNLLAETATGPAAFYKDCNPRNFLVTGDGTIYAIDVDDLTFAPFGYDLAKLTLTLQMTCGRLRSGDVTGALAAYNRAAAAYGEGLAVSRAQLDAFRALHQIFNAPYAGRHGYLRPAS
jgi:Ser/Thr protein kinase RdoA (MazF antagonist)